MKNLILTSLLLFSINDTLALVHGKDNRVPSHLFKGLSKLKEASKAVAAKVNFGLINKENSSFYKVGLIKGPAEYGEGKYILTGRVNKQEKSMCSEEKFVNHLSFATCSGFLIAEDILVTQVHCLTNHYNQETKEITKSCEGAAWVFNIPTDVTTENNSTKLSTKDQKGLDIYQVGNKIYQEGRDVFNCEKVLAWSNDWSEDSTNWLDHLSSYGSNEYAVIKLDKKVPGIKPLKISTEVKNNMRVSSIGYGQNLTQKITSGAKVFNEGVDQYFSTNLDIFPGDSGGPILNNKGEVIGMISGVGEEVYGFVAYPGRSCLKNLKVSENGVKIVDGIRAPISNFHGRVAMSFRTHAAMFIPNVLPYYQIQALKAEGPYYISPIGDYDRVTAKQFEKGLTSNAPVLPRAYGVKVGQLKKYEKY